MLSEIGFDLQTINISNINQYNTIHVIGIGFDLLAINISNINQYNNIHVIWDWI
jgi:uncharacterized membrane protein